MISIILCVSNPLDVMTYMVHKATGWERNRIIGMAGALDGSRMAYQIHKKVVMELGKQEQWLLATTAKI